MDPHGFQKMIGAERGKIRGFLGSKKGVFWPFFGVFWGEAKKGGFLTLFGGSQRGVPGEGVQKGVIFRGFLGSKRGSFWGGPGRGV